MADKRISQLIERVDIANNDVLPIVASGATTTNKVTISTIQDWMQDNLDVGVTSVGITIGSTGTDVSVSGSPVTSSGNITINLPTASATNRGLLSAADWSTFNSKQDAGSFVTLDTTQTITAQKTFTTSGSSDTMIISHGSGSGFALDVLKAGNGEAIRVTKTSGTGNAMTISGGNFEAGTIVKTGGTSSQFLKADGSVDSSTYLTTGTASSTYVPYSGAAASVNLGVYSITANAINSAGSGSTAGQINLRSDAFFSLVNGYGSIASGTTNQFNLYQTTGAGVFRGAILSLNSITASATRTYTLPDASGTLALSTDLGAYLPLAGGTLTGALNGTSASFTGAVTSQGLLTIGNISSGSNSIIAFANTGNPSPRYLYYKASNGSINVTNDSGIDQFTISNSGSVGIGTNTPSARLHVLNSTGGTTSSNYVQVEGSIADNSNYPGIVLKGGTLATTYPTISLTNGGLGLSLNGGFATAYNNPTQINLNNGTISFSTGNNASATERMQITSGGFLKASSNGTFIDLSQPYYELTNNNSGANIAYLWHRASNPYGPYIRFNGFAPNNATNYYFYCDDNSSVRYILYSNGGIANYQANNVNLSDERTKKDIEPLESYWDKFKEIEIVKFKYKNQTHDDFNIGVIAQQVEAVAPEFVDVDGWDNNANGNEIVSEEEPLKSIYTSDLHHATIKVLQEAMAKIEELQAQIDSLKNQIK